MTDIVDRSIEESADDRLSKRVLRLTSTSAAFGLELVEYPDCHEATLHVLESNDWAEADQTFAVDDVQVLDQQVRRGQTETVVQAVRQADDIDSYAVPPGDVHPAPTFRGERWWTPTSGASATRSVASRTPPL